MHGFVAARPNPGTARSGPLCRCLTQCAPLSPLFSPPAPPARSSGLMFRLVLLTLVAFLVSQPALIESFSVVSPTFRPSLVTTSSRLLSYSPSSPAKTTSRIMSSLSSVSQYASLASVTTIVADTGNIADIKKYAPTDATTNPSLVYKAALLPEYAPLVSGAVTYAKANAASPAAVLSLSLDKLSVDIGVEISKLVPGYVSTEVDARLSFDAAGTIAKARQLIRLYEDAGVPRGRVLVKIASTWEGIKAAEVLQAEGISCNLTLLFSLAQAAACADAKCTLISPFVGRITDWHKKNSGVASYPPESDPGVLSVRTIYNYYKKFGAETIVMGASFRNAEQIIALAGCDRLTIAPELLGELLGREGAVPLQLEASKAKDRYDGEKLDMSEDKFRWMMNEDAMATEKLAEGIRNFAKDLVKLEDVIKKLI